MKDIHPKLLFVQNIHLNCQTVLAICTKHSSDTAPLKLNILRLSFASSDTAVFCVKSQTYLKTKRYVMGKRESVRFASTHWGRVTHLRVSKLTSIASDNGMSPGRRQAIIWTNAGILLIGPLQTNFGEILSELHTFSFKKMRMKISSGKWRQFCLRLNVLKMRFRLISDIVTAPKLGIVFTMNWAIFRVDYKQLNQHLWW